MEVTLVPMAGNSAAMNFPHTGYFGVTPVRVRGTARVKAPCPEALVPIRWIELALRCFEIREGGPLRSSKENTLWETRKMVWTPPEGQKEVMLDDWSEQFDLEIPPEVADIASGVKQLREWRVRWRVEITVEHKPITGVGDCFRNTYNLRLFDHRAPKSLRPEPPLTMNLRSNYTTTLVRVKAPHRAYGPEEEVKIMAAITPEDPYAIIRKVQVVLERRMELLDHKSAVAALREREEASPSLNADSAKQSRMSTLFSRGNSPRRTAPQENNSRVFTQRIVDTVCDITQPDAENTSWVKGVLKLPVRGHRWDMAHTEQTMFVDITFSIRIKITLKPGKGRGGSQVLETDPIPIFILACSRMERRNAARALRDITGHDYEEDSERSDSIRRAKRRHRHAGRTAMDIASITNSDDFDPPPPTYEPVAELLRSPRAVPRRQFYSHPSASASSSRPHSILCLDPVHAHIPAHTHVPPPDHPHAQDPIHDPTHAQLLSHALDPALTTPLSPPPRYRLSPTPAPSLGASSAASSAIVSPDPTVDLYEDDAIRARARLTGRRISTTASEDEEVQPRRARQKLQAIPEPTMLSLGSMGVLAGASSGERPGMGARQETRQSLPSLDALGFGLPELHAHERPRTAPTYGGRQAVPAARPMSSSGAFAFTTPFARRSS